MRELREREVRGRPFAYVDRGDPTRVRLVRGPESELAMVRVGTPILPKTQQQSLRDEVWRCPADRRGFEPERLEQREAAKFPCDASEQK